jgi:hypothetical protein
VPAKTRRDVKRLCGFLNWFRPFIKKLSQRIKPISDMTSGKTRIKWTDDKTAIVDSIIKDIISRLTLALSNYEEPFILETDASETVMGAVLYQKERLIGIFSKKFGPAQTRYTVTEKEFFAIYAALKHFRNIIYLSHIVIYTDHANLTFKTTPVTNRTQRWMLAIEEFDHEIVFKK